MAIFDEIRQAALDLDFLSDSTAGELRIGCTEAILTAIVSPLVRRLTLQYPRIIFHIVSRNPPLLGQELRARTIELAISRIIPPAEEDESIEVLFQDRMVIVTGRKNPLTSRRHVTLADLVNERWVGPDSILSKWIADSFVQSPPQMSVINDSIRLYSELAATGRFLTVLPGFALKLPQPNPSLRALPLILPNSEGPVGIRTPQNRQLSPLAQLFCERVRALTTPLAKC